MNTTTHPIKEFFTDSEWDLIHDLLDSNRQYEDEDNPYLEDYYTALNKIRSLFEEND
jgi:hypothetical protein